MIMNVFKVIFNGHIMNHARQKSSFTSICCLMLLLPNVCVCLCSSLYCFYCGILREVLCLPEGALHAVRDPYVQCELVHMYHGPTTYNRKSHVAHRRCSQHRLQYKNKKKVCWRSSTLNGQIWFCSYCYTVSILNSRGCCISRCPAFQRFGVNVTL